MTAVIKVRRDPGLPDSAVQVVLIEDRPGVWIVRFDGRDWGTIGKHEGRLDLYRGLSRGQRRDGKLRTFWWCRGPERDARTMHYRDSRADAIRWLM